MKTSPRGLYIARQVRGYSVVIGAVEAAITEHPLVSTAVVMTEGEEGSMDKKLVAYIVPDCWEKVRGDRPTDQPTVCASQLVASM